MQLPNATCPDVCYRHLIPISKEGHTRGSPSAWSSRLSSCVCRHEGVGHGVELVVVSALATQCKIVPAGCARGLHSPAPTLVPHSPSLSHSRLPGCLLMQQGRDRENRRTTRKHKRSQLEGAERAGAARRIFRD